MRRSLISLAVVAVAALGASSASALVATPHTTAITNGGINTERAITNGQGDARIIQVRRSSSRGFSSRRSSRPSSSRSIRSGGSFWSSKKNKPAPKVTTRHFKESPNAAAKRKQLGKAFNDTNKARQNGRTLGNNRSQNSATLGNQRSQSGTRLGGNRSQNSTALGSNRNQSSRNITPAKARERWNSMPAGKKAAKQNAFNQRRRDLNRVTTARNNSSNRNRIAAARRAGRDRVSVIDRRRTRIDDDWGYDRWSSYRYGMPGTLYMGSHPALISGLMFHATFGGTAYNCRPTVTGLVACGTFPFTRYYSPHEFYWAMNPASRASFAGAMQQHHGSFNAGSQPSAAEMERIRNSQGATIDTEGQPPAEGYEVAYTKEIAVDEAHKVLPPALQGIAGKQVNLYSASPNGNYTQVVMLPLKKKLEAEGAIVTITNLSGTPAIRDAVANDPNGIGIIQEDGLVGHEYLPLGPLLAQVYPEYGHLVCTEDSGVDEFSDLDDDDYRVIAAGGSHLMYSNFGVLDDNYASSEGAKLNKVASDQIANMLAGDQADCAFFTTSLGSGAINNLVTQIGRSNLVLVGFDDSDIFDDLPATGKPVYFSGEIPRELNGDEMYGGIEYEGDGWFSSDIDAPFVYATTVANNGLNAKVKNAARQSLLELLPQIHQQVGYRP